MSIRSIWIFALLGAARLWAQADPLAAAAQALENRDYARCVSLVAMAERQIGASPRLESIRAMAWHEAGNAVEAFKSLERYAELTRGIAGLDANSNHRELLELLQEYRGRLEKERKEKEEKLKTERDAEAERIVKAERDAVERKRRAVLQRLEGKLAAMAPQRMAEITAEDVAELKRMGVTGIASRYDERVFRIKELDGGKFRLGMTREEIETLIHARLRDVSASDQPVLHRIVHRYELPRTPRVRLGVTFNVIDGKNSKRLSTGTALEELAWSEPDFRLHADQAELLHRLNAATAVESSPIRSLMPQATSAGLAEIGFREERVAELVFVLCLPHTTDPETVFAALTQRFGRVQAASGAEADGVRRYQPARDYLRGGEFAFAAVEGLQLFGRVVQSVEADLKVPVFLELKLKRLAGGEDPLQAEPVNATGLERGARFAHLRREAVLAVNEAQRLANQMTWEAGGERLSISTTADGFRLVGPHATQRFRLVDPATKAEREVVFAEIPLYAARELKIQETHVKNAANVVLVHFDQPLRPGGAATGLAPETAVFFSALYGKQLSQALRRAALLALDAVAHQLPAETLGRQIARLDDGVGREELIRGLIGRAEAQGKAIDPLIVARYSADVDPAKQMSSLRRAAESGSTAAMRQLLELHRKQGAAPPKNAITAAEAQRWAKAGAELGDEACTRRLIELIELEDYAAADRWTKELVARRSGVDPAYVQQRETRAQRLAQVRALKPDERIRQYLPPDFKNVIGQKFEDFAKGRAFVVERQETSAVTGRPVTVQRLASTRDVKPGEPVSVWVNRRGVVVGAYYFVARYWRWQHGYLRQVFDPAQLTALSSATPGLQEAIGVVPNKFKTIEMYRYAQDSYLKVIDHTKE